MASCMYCLTLMTRSRYHMPIEVDSVWRRVQYKDRQTTTQTTRQTIKQTKLQMLGQIGAELFRQTRADAESLRRIHTRHSKP